MSQKASGGEALDVQVRPPGVDVAVYETTGEPPSKPGTQSTWTAAVAPICAATTEVGASGGAAAIAGETMKNDATTVTAVAPPIRARKLAVRARENRTPDTSPPTPYAICNCAPRRLGRHRTSAHRR
jgi:hypothetical protein